MRAWLQHNVRIVSPPLAASPIDVDSRAKAYALAYAVRSAKPQAAG
jgi:hypothetical protein